MDQREQPVQLQTDTIAPLPGAGIRTIIAKIPINGVLTDVQMQVVSLADGNGNVIDTFQDYNQNIAIVQELREIRKLLCLAYGIPAIFEPLPELERDPNSY